MTKRLRFVTLLVAIAAFGIPFVVLHPQAEEVEESEPSAVSESDLQTYINVYSAMQDDHDLVIDDAIKPYSLSLDGFRHLERRIQAQSRLVDRVRQALLEHAKAKSAFAQSPSTPTPGESGDGGKKATQKKP